MDMAVCRGFKQVQTFIFSILSTVAVAVQHAAQLQRRTTVGVVVLDAQVLGLLGVDEGSGEEMCIRDSSRSERGC